MVNFKEEMRKEVHLILKQRERKHGNSCRSVRFLNESKKDKGLKNNFEQNNQVPKKVRHSIENARNHPLWPKFVPTFTLNPRLLNYWDGPVKKGVEFDSISSMNINASKTVKGKIIRCDKKVFWTFVDVRLTDNCVSTV